MIRTLKVSNFTVFQDLSIELGKNLNVFVGENGTGKSHLLKLVYALYAVMAQGGRESGDSVPDNVYLTRAIAKKLKGVFQPDELGRLVQRRPGVQRAKVAITGSDVSPELSFSFHSKSKHDVYLQEMPSSWVSKSPAFLPTRELLSIYPGFVSLYETTAIPFEETWRDTCVLLGAPLARGPREASIKDLLEPLEAALDGKIVLESSGRFYLNRGEAHTEMHLVAEGLRKLAMVARLVATGTLLDQGSLFWDEPEANLNPKLIKEVAKVIIALSKGGIQVFVATHSLFLLRELYLLQQGTGLDTRCFGLHINGEGLVDVQAGSTIDEIGDIAALDEELEQSDRYLEREAALAGAS